MARPKIPESERREHNFRLRLNESDALAIRRKARLLGLPPSTLIMSIIHAKINNDDDSIKFSFNY